MLAQLHTTARPEPAGNFDAFTRQLRLQHEFLLHAVQQFRLTANKPALPYTAEWVLDNFYLIEQTYRQIAEDIPRGFYLKLPKISDGPMRGHPRIYAITQDFVVKERAHVDGAGLDRLRRIIHLYQDVQVEMPLTMAELWAAPIMLRIGVLEVLAQALARVLTTTTYAGLPGVELPGEVLDEQVVPSCFISLRTYATQDWRDFFERVSRVEAILKSEPAGIYASMDKETRDRYRKVVEQLAERTRRQETAVAQAALDMAGSEHIGSVLLGPDQIMLERQLGFRPKLAQRLQRWVLHHPTIAYLSSVGLVLAVLLYFVLTYANTFNATVMQMFVIGVLGMVVASQIAVSLVDWAFTVWLPPTVLPKLNYAEAETGIPARHSTFVVIPALLSNAEEVTSLLGQLELHYLRNQDAQVRFGLLTDFTDALEQHLPADAALIEQAVAGIQLLNQRYAMNGSAPFYLFHRERRWNPREGTWMGWERKRGKLHELNQLLRQTELGQTSYVTTVGDLAALNGTRYVITLDADTILQPNDARRLVATLAHPLNQAHFDAQSGQLTRGYSILQPRTEILPATATRTWFTRLFSGDIGLDLYTRAISNVYQDLFGEGIYVGKGIYDVDALERSLAGRVPENALLSHDLFEGVHGRVGLVNDVVVFEEYPPNYLVHMRRSRRWVRGDWQLLPWLLPHVPHAGPGRINNTLSVIHRWKILDNLRRSLLAPAITLWWLLAWLWLPGSPYIETVFGLMALAIPVFTGTLNAAHRAVKTGTLQGELNPLRDGVLRWILAVCFLPYESIEVLGGIAQTLIRLFITRRNLLQWTTAAQTVRAFGEDLSSWRTWLKMVPAAAFTSPILIAVIWLRPAALPVAVPVLLVWLISPQIAHWIGRPMRLKPDQLTPKQMRMLRHVARSTWSFFEQFVGPDQHWLPPDNYQESPKGMVMPHTSPTNIGLMLLSTLAAYDFGYIGLQELVSRLQLAFDSIAKLERHRGHLLNWYDTRSLQTLQPRYVSTVDSGNFLACLIALANGCRELRHQPVLRWARWQGWLDLVGMLEDVLAHTQGLNKPGQPLREQVADMRNRVLAVKGDVSQWRPVLDELVMRLVAIGQELVALITPPGLEVDVSALRVLRDTLDRAERHLLHMQSEWDALIPSLREPRSGFNLHTTLVELAARPESNQPAQELLDGLSHIEQDCEQLFANTDFAFLFDAQRKLFRIGYNLSSDRLDDNCYDLLASEAHIASVLAIAKRDVPAEHWLHLGRPLTESGGQRVLMSWSATMFEYLMPALWIRSYEGTLLHQTRIAAVGAQIRYGQQHHMPWGVSESGYYAFDAAQNYQYQAFGVPELGFKRHLVDSLVIAPYATLLALPIRPKAAAENISKLLAMKMLGAYGLYEAMDFTPAHLSVGNDHAIVRSYMSHHQGMSLLSLSNYLLDDVMVRRFHADPRVQSVELMLQERVPVSLLPDQQRTHANASELAADGTTIPDISTAAWSVPVHAPLPMVHVLSNGRYSVMVTSAGGGYSRWNNLDLTRWKPDTTLDDSGVWLYLQDVDRNVKWSASHQPACASIEEGDVHFHPHMAVYRSRHHDIASLLEVTVAPDEDVEIRRLSLTNHSDETRHVRATSYGEVILTTQANDRRHPAFNKLFIEHEVLDDAHTLLFRRRPRSPAEAQSGVYMAHTTALPKGESPEVVRCECETDRARFWADKGGRTLSGPDDNLDPVFSISQLIEIGPHSTAQIGFVTLVAPSRQQAIGLARRYQTWRMINRAFDLAQTRARLELHRLNLGTPQLALMQHVLSALLFPHRAMRAEPARLAANVKGQPGLWAYAISGDYPVLLMRVRDEDSLTMAQQLVQAHTYWRNRGVQVDLVFSLQQPSSYNQELHGQLQRLLMRMNSQSWLARRGGIFIVSADLMSEEDRVLLDSTARVVLDPQRGSLAEQVQVSLPIGTALPDFMPSRSSEPIAAETTPVLERPAHLQFDNGWGGFSSDGKEYVIYLEPNQSTPAPWINVISNPDFGFLISERGSGYTWALNSGENRLTPWSNDAVKDAPGEALYVRDEETAEVWSPVPAPCPAHEPYLVRHGAGYSSFEHHSHGLIQHTRFGVARDAPVKIVQLRMQNTWSRPRRITVTFYAEWVMGVNRDGMQQFVVTEFDNESQALLARNAYNAEFGGRVTFLAASKRLHGLTADRTEFLGRMGDVSQPAALRRLGLAGTVGAGFDPCGALQLHLDLPAGGMEEIYFILGQGATHDEALKWVHRYQDATAVQAEFEAVQQSWDDILGEVQVETPDPAMNLLLNHWLLYQALACRIWGRSGFYQSSGAYGFRDQLQDVLALLHTRPHLAREHLLRAAQHQFDAGDVLHWWHPPTGRGVRTRCSDDLLWLVYATAHYVHTTGDASVLDESMPLLAGPVLKAGEEDYYGQFATTPERATLFEHCCRAIERGSTMGVHGLPLMGSGDWNDGMNRVGIEGKGESVWLGWFLGATLSSFAEVCERVGQPDRAVTYRERATKIRDAIEQHAWDGEWYLRAFYDDGTPLGSHLGDECQIDAISQSWAVMSGLGEAARAEQAMRAVSEKLVRAEDRCVLLLTPPFDQTTHDPGYIRGYVPGIRENGGQYTHAAIWTAWAFAALGKGNKAGQLFDLLNPIYHADTPEKAARYKVEPYVIAADVYASAGRVGRGGWTWYTGSAGWMYRFGLEAILGIQRIGDTVLIKPCIPSHWPGYQVRYRAGDTAHQIRVEQTNGVIRIVVDGHELRGNTFDLTHSTGQD